jgi:elongation factor 1-beta
MGEVAAKIKIMPESIDVDLDELKGALEKVIPEGVRLHAFGEEPIAFGLKALIAAVILSDSTGGTEEVEAAFATVENVESVEVVEVGLI